MAKIIAIGAITIGFFIVAGESQAKKCRALCREICEEFYENAGTPPKSIPAPMKRCITSCVSGNCEGDR